MYYIFLKYYAYGIHSYLLNVAIAYLLLLSSILMYEYNSVYLLVKKQIFSFMNYVLYIDFYILGDSM